MGIVELSVPFVNQSETKEKFSLGKFFGSSDMAMDLGTANTLVYVKGHGIVLNEPSVVAVSEEAGKPVAIGHDAKNMFGKTSQAVRCIRPMKDGVIADFDMTTVMISDMLSRVRKKYIGSSFLPIFRPRIVIGVPSGITQVEKKAVIDAALFSGARDVMLVEEPMAAALGVGLPIDKPVGNMIVDIGGGTTEVAILSLNGTVYSHSIRVAGDEMDEAIQRHLRRLYGIHVGVFEAERVKLLVGSALPLGKSRTVTIYGRDSQNGIPHQIEVSDEVIREALQEPIAAIISSVVTALEQTTPEVAHDIMSRGIHMAGGGSLLRGLCERLHRETGIPFIRAQDPLTCVVRGVGKVIESLKELRVLCVA